MTLVLGSSSARRRALLKAVGVVYSLARPDIDETPYPNEAPIAYVQRLSREKALAVQPDGTGKLILTADTTVVEAGAIVGKPADADEARIMLQRLRGKAHTVFTGVSLRDLATGEIDTRLVETTVYMRDYSDAEIEAYIATGEPFDKAGGYGAQDSDLKPVSRIEGCLTNVIGLPMCVACQMLAAHQIEAQHPPTCAPQPSPNGTPCTFDMRAVDAL
ncbi:MAG: nucleoside triphosphate pyrophosphatase [Anaerolineae bacterium]